MSNTANLTIRVCPRAKRLEMAELLEVAERERLLFQPALPAQEQSFGLAPWGKPPHLIDTEEAQAFSGMAPDSFFPWVQGAYAFQVVEQRKDLPKRVIDEHAEQRLLHQLGDWEHFQAMEPHEQKQMMEELREQAKHDLMPSAFSKFNSWQGWFDAEEGLLVIQDVSDKNVDAVIELLTYLVEGLGAERLEETLGGSEAVSDALSGWLLRGAPAGMRPHQSLKLVRPEQVSASVTLKKEDIESSSEVRDLIHEGRSVAELECLFQEQWSLRLDPQLRVRGLKPLEREEEGETVGSLQRLRLSQRIQAIRALVRWFKANL